MCSMNVVNYVCNQQHCWKILYYIYKKNWLYFKYNCSVLLCTENFCRIRHNFITSLKETLNYKSLCIQRFQKQLVFVIVFGALDCNTVQICQRKLILIFFITTRHEY